MKNFGPVFGKYFPLFLVFMSSLCLVSGNTFAFECYVRVFQRTDGGSDSLCFTVPKVELRGFKATLSADKFLPGKDACWEDDLIVSGETLAQQKLENFEVTLEWRPGYANHVIGTAPTSVHQRVSFIWKGGPAAYPFSVSSDQNTTDVHGRDTGPVSEPRLEIDLPVSGAAKKKSITVWSYCSYSLDR